MTKTYLGLFSNRGELLHEIRTTLTEEQVLKEVNELLTDVLPHGIYLDVFEEDEEKSA